jgi:hypothetical protein
MEGLTLLLDWKPLARTWDPITSKEAAASQKDTLLDKQRKVLGMVTLMGRTGVSAEDLARMCERHYGWPATKSTARTRLSELADMGKVEWTGECVTLSSGRRAKLWRAK